VTSITETVTTYTAVVPVDLFKFAAKPTENGNLLDWATASEHNNSRFEIERAENATDFERIGEVKGSLNSNSLNTYSFLDKNPLLGINYYRLKQVDMDGTFMYSKTLSVSNIKDEKDAHIFIHPNPASDVLVVQSLTDNTVNKTVELINLQGKVIQSKTLFQGSTMCLFDLQTVYAGTYFVKIVDGQQTKVTKIVVKN
jgi:hypothetical protein